MTDKDISDVLLNILSNILERPFESHMSPVDLLSSLQIFSFIVAIESRFSIKFHNSDMNPSSFHSIDQLITLINLRQS